MADFDYDGPADPIPQRPRRQASTTKRTYSTPGAPVRRSVRVRLAGQTDLDVLFVLDVLRDVFTIADVSRLIPLRDGSGFRCYLTVSRRTPLSGGIK